MRALALSLPLMLIATLGQAQDLTCSFEIECLDTEGCQPTDYDVTFGQIQDRWLMSGIAGERAFESLAEEDDGHRAFVSGSQNGAVGLMTILADGSATYTEVGLFEGAYAVRYHGTCAEAE